jgi:uncharacterized integral membrane protein (TIGR00697 family)
LNGFRDEGVFVNEKKSYKYYDFVMAAFVTSLLCAELIGAPKVSVLFGYEFGSAILFFPISYIFGDILTEVYGYKRARRVVWAGFIATFYGAFMSHAVISMPPAPGWPHQEAYEVVYGNSIRIVVASVFAYFFGELSNSYVLAKMKIWTKGKHLWSRTIGSTIVGEAVDSVLFYPLAFLGVWETRLVIAVMFANFALKVGFEILFTPITYKIVNFLKKAESEDYYDYGTDFTPFSIKT